MFKRLFIGLIILSALTTEGIINTPWNIYNLCLFVDSVSSFSEEANKTFEPLTNNLTSKISFSELVAENRLFTESKGIAEIKYDLSVKPILNTDMTKLHHFFKFTDDRCALSYSFSGTHPDHFFGLDKDIIISISDTSPPSYSL